MGRVHRNREFMQGQDKTVIRNIAYAGNIVCRIA